MICQTLKQKFTGGAFLVLEESSNCYKSQSLSYNPARLTAESALLLCLCIIYLWSYSLHVTLFARTDLLCTILCVHSALCRNTHINEPVWPPTDSLACTHSRTLSLFLYVINGSWGHFCDHWSWFWLTSFPECQKTVLTGTCSPLLTPTQREKAQTCPTHLKTRFALNSRRPSGSGEGKVWPAGLWTGLSAKLWTALVFIFFYSA